MWLHKDHLGSIQAATGADGAAALRRGYAPYGAQLWATAATFTEAKNFVGERLDAETGLLYLNARSYDPVMGQFLSADPSDPLQPGVGVNRYAYALNNPVFYNDPYGLHVGPDENGRAEFERDSPSHSTNDDRDDLGLENTYGTLALEREYGNFGSWAKKVAGVVFNLGRRLFGGPTDEEIEAQSEKWAQDLLEFLNRQTNTLDLNGYRGHRYMSKAELEAVQETGQLRGGRPGETYTTKDLYDDPKTAADMLSLEVEPEVRVEFEVRNHPTADRFDQSVEPAFGRPGGGTEIRALDPVEVEILDVHYF